MLPMDSNSALIREKVSVLVNFLMTACRARSENPRLTGGAPEVGQNHTHVRGGSVGWQAPLTQLICRNNSRKGMFELRSHTSK